MGQLAARIGDVELMTAIADLVGSCATAIERLNVGEPFSVAFSDVVQATVPVSVRTGQLLLDGL